ncbi:MAG TPA: choice-of-anchor D domain-containing protein, partial [Solirubrobacteraceae bacterium]|nr:choice-of-anchor D domain-containing protein [Solirubrobacteraceae bacterium]
PGETLTINVTFKPSTGGKFTGSLSLTTQAGETTVTLTGYGEEPGLTPSTKSLNLGSVPAGKQTSDELTLKNTGTTTLEIKSEHTPTAPFGATGLPATGTKIKPGETLTVKIAFKPSAGGEFHDSLSVTTEAGETTITLTGFAEEPALIPSTTTLEVGSVLIGKQISNEMTLKNTGNTTLEIKSQHTPSSPFTATGLPSNTTKIKPGETLTINVTFKPSALGEFKDSLSLTTQAGETTVTLTGFAQEPTTTAQTLPSTVTPQSGISPFVEAKEPAPTLTDLQVRAKSARSNPHLHKLLVSYDLSAANAVELAVERMTISRHCSQGGRTCDHWSMTKVSSKVTGHAGANSLTLSLAELSAGEYRLAATPIARSGAVGTTHYLHFLTRG